jgi:hypothetical protein
MAVLLASLGYSGFQLQAFLQGMCEEYGERDVIIQAAIIARPMAQ